MTAQPFDSASFPVVLYDGECGFCDASVQWLLAHDPTGRYRFAPLQGDTAAAIRARHPELPKDLDSIVLVEGPPGEEHAVWRSEAIFRICAQLPGAWRAISWFGVLPRFITDAGYRIFARLRYHVWGRLEACRVPSAAERARFLP